MQTVIPECARIALREITGVHSPVINTVTDANRNYLHSGLAIALTYYEQYQQPARCGYRRTFYYTHRPEFPHAAVFTHVDTEVVYG